MPFHYFKPLHPILTFCCAFKLWWDNNCTAWIIQYLTTDVQFMIMENSRHKCDWKSLGAKLYNINVLNRSTISVANDCVQCIQHFRLNKRAICSLLRHSSQKSSHRGLLYLMLTKSCIRHFHLFKNPCKHCWGINLLQMIKYQIK